MIQGHRGAHTALHAFKKGRIPVKGTDNDFQRDHTVHGLVAGLIDGKEGALADLLQHFVAVTDQMIYQSVISLCHSARIGNAR